MFIRKSEDTVQVVLVENILGCCLYINAGAHPSSSSIPEEKPPCAI